MKTLGLRHVALNVASAQRSKDFYTRFFGMQVEWEPDPQNVFLTSGGQDNLALHELKDWTPQRQGEGLDHIGFFLKNSEEVDAAYSEIKASKIEIVRPLKRHRDGAYSFYLKDPDGYIIQVIYHAPVCDRQQG